MGVASPSGTVAMAAFCGVRLEWGFASAWASGLVGDFGWLMAQEYRRLARAGHGAVAILNKRQRRGAPRTGQIHSALRVVRRKALTAISPTSCSPIWLAAAAVGESERPRNRREVAIHNPFPGALLPSRNTSLSQVFTYAFDVRRSCESVLTRIRNVIRILPLGRWTMSMGQEEGAHNRRLLER